MGNYKGYSKAADQIKSMGLKVGDTIEGTEKGDDWFNTTRLTLLWVGESEAAWMCTYISSLTNVWSEPKEATNWTLAYRDWVKL